MVHHVEGGHLVVLVPHNHEECVHEVSELGEEVPPDGGGHVHAVLRVRVVDRLAHPAVLAAQPEAGQPGEDPGAEESLQEVVEEHQLLDVVRGPALHEGGAGEPDQVVVEHAEAQGRPGRGHQQPGVDPGAIQNISLEQNYEVTIIYLLSLSSVMMKSYLPPRPMDV